MPSIRRLFSSIRGHVRLRTIALVLLAGVVAVIAAPPAWWSARGITNQNPADDYAPLNQGQLKNLVKAAVQELDSTLPGGAGDTLHAMITRWATPTAQPDDYAAVNLGQLKAAATPVYDRLKTIGYAAAYPWEGSGNPPDDYAMANIGQAKRLFAFDLTTDTNSVGIPDWWRNKYGLQFANANAALASAPGGLTYLQKYLLGLDPSKTDSDGDGTSDGDEVAAGSNPKNPVSTPPKAYAAVEVAIFSSVTRATASFGDGPSGRFHEVTPQYFTGNGTEIISEYDGANPGFPILRADDALTVDEKAEYLDKANLPDTRPSTDYEGAAWKTDWMNDVTVLPNYFYPMVGSETIPPPKLRGNWFCNVHKLTEEIDAGIPVETGVWVQNDRIGSMPLPPLPPANVTSYAGALIAGGEYTFTDLPYGHLGTGVQTTSTTFDANAWLTIDTASLDETTRLLYSPTTGPYTATTDGKYGNRAAFWIKTDNGAPAGAAITRTYLKVTTTLASSGGTPPNPVTETVTLTIPKGKKSSAITSLVAAQGKMVSLLPWEFRARDQFSDSFDPPLIGDIHPPTGAKDKDDWVAWTSVARIGGYNTNNRTKLVFPSDSEASMFDLAVAADSLQFITVQPTHLTTKETNLTIHGLPGNVIEMASIELRQKGTTNVVGRLRVMALPERNTISCTFYRVHEPNEDPANILRPGFYPVPTVNSPVAGPGTATGEIDDRMAQAVVSASTTSPIIEMTVDYEPNNGGNGILDTDAEFEVFRRKRQQGLFNGSCNVIYVPFLDTVEGELAVVVSPASKLVFIAQNEWVASGTAQPDAKLLAPEDAKGVSWQMDRVIAHEFGHYLEISTRQAGTVTPTGGHDDGMHPPGTAPLMRSGPAGGSGRWMRHEDWEMANRRAKDRLQ